MQFSEKSARQDAVDLGHLAPDVKDPAVRRAAQAIAKKLPAALTSDDTDNQIAALLSDLRTACKRWAS